MTEYPIEKFKTQNGLTSRIQLVPLQLCHLSSSLPTQNQTFVLKPCCILLVRTNQLHVYLLLSINSPLLVDRLLSVFFHRHFFAPEDGLDVFGVQRFVLE